MINLFFPANQYWEECTQAVGEVLKSRWWGQAHKVDEFERKFADEFAYRYCLALNSGTAALELAYRLCEISPGDEVITPVLTCTATNIPLLRLGAKVVFADVRKDDLTIDVADVEKRITDKTRAIVGVTLGGLPLDPKLFELAEKHKIPVIVDAAQSLGVTESRGDYICYSFQAIKHFTTGDGGMLVLTNPEEYDRAKKLRWFGIDRDAKIQAGWQAYRFRQMTIDIEEPGFKFHMNDISAVLGLVGLAHTKEILEKRKSIAQRYDKELKNCHKIAGGSFWLYGVLIDNRDQCAEKLLEAGIDVNMVHLRNDIYNIFGGKRLALRNMNEVENRYLYLPIHPGLSTQDVDEVVFQFNRIVR